MAAHVLDRRVRYTGRREQGGILYELRHLDITLVGSTLVLAAIGIVTVYSATRSIYPDEPTYFMKRQIIYVVGGVLVMIITMAIDYRRLAEWAYPICGFITVMLLAVLVIGRSVTAGSGSEVSGSAQRWIPLGPFQFQPSEFGVIGVVLVLAYALSSHRNELNARRTAYLAAMVGLPTLLILRQPDLGTTIVMLIVALTIATIAGIRARYLIGLIALVIVGFFVATKLGVIGHTQFVRFTSFLHQDRYSSTYNYNLDNAKIAIGAGGLRGVGLFHGAVTTLQYVPNQYADFIFSAIGEQFGFVGGAAVIGIYAILGLRMIRALQTAGDGFGRLICAGALAFLTFSVFQNIGMNIGLMPITGIPLPFVSYGGSALLAFFAMVGLVANVEMRRRSIR